MVEVVNPRLGESVLDPACGTGGFLVEAFAHLEKQCKTVADYRTLQDRSVLGGEAKPLPYLLCQMNLLLHGLEAQEPVLNRPAHDLDAGHRRRRDLRGSARGAGEALRSH